MSRHNARHIVCLTIFQVTNTKSHYHYLINMRYILAIARLLPTYTYLLDVEVELKVDLAPMNNKLVTNYAATNTQQTIIDNMKTELHLQSQ